MKALSRTSSQTIVFPVLDREPQQATCPIEEEPPKATPSLPLPTSTLFFPFTRSLKAFEFERFFKAGRRDFSSQTEDF